MPTTENKIPYWGVTAFAAMYLVGTGVIAWLVSLALVSTDPVLAEKTDFMDGFLRVWVAVIFGPVGLVIVAAMFGGSGTTKTKDITVDIDGSTYKGKVKKVD